MDKVQKESADKEKKWLEKHKYHNMLSSYSNTSGMVKKSDKDADADGNLVAGGEGVRSNSQIHPG